MHSMVFVISQQTLDVDELTAYLIILKNVASSNKQCSTMSRTERSPKVSANKDNKIDLIGLS